MRTRKLPRKSAAAASAAPLARILRGRISAGYTHTVPIHPTQGSELTVISKIWQTQAYPM